MRHFLTILCALVLLSSCASNRNTTSQNLKPDKVFTVTEEDIASGATLDVGSGDVADATDEIEITVTNNLIDGYGRKIGQGDMLVNITVYVPEKLSKEEKAWMEEFHKSPNAKPKTTSGMGAFFSNLFGNFK